MLHTKKVHSSADDFDIIDRWENEDTLEDPNVFAHLYTKLNHYEHAYRQAEKKKRG